MEILKCLEASVFFLSCNHEANAAAIASVTGSVRVTGSPSTPTMATPRISLCKVTLAQNQYYRTHLYLCIDTPLLRHVTKFVIGKLSSPDS